MILFGSIKEWFIQIVKPFGQSLATVVLLVLSGMLIKALVKFALPEESQFLGLVEFVLNITVVGTAIIVAVCGFIVVAWDTLKATKDFISDGGRK